MKLYYTATSPYARKVRVVAHELGTEIEEVLVNPLENPEALLEVNPLAKVPGFELEDGTSIIDSRVICEMLAAGTPIELADWSARSRAAWADGVLDLALQAVMESRRTDAEISQWWMSRWRDQILRTVSWMEGQVGELQGFRLPEIGWAVALAYLDFRLPELEWRSQAPDLGDWHASVMSRPSMEATTPPG